MTINLKMLQAKKNNLITHILQSIIWRVKLHEQVYSYHQKKEEEKKTYDLSEKGNELLIDKWLQFCI